MSDDAKEQRLLKRIGEGNSAALRQLYDCYAGYLTAVAARYIPDEDALKDVLQDAFVKILTRVKNFQYRGEGSLKAWMTRIVVNKALDCLAMNKKYESLVTDVDDEVVGEDVSSVNEPDDVDDVPMDIILEMIRRLPVGYRSVFNLYVFEGRSHKEIAKLLNIKESSSASQFHRAKAMLAREIKRYVETLKN